MSYILDALKKADSERERGAVPGIHAQQVPHMAVSVKPASNLKLVLWLIVGLLAIILGFLAWRVTVTPQADPLQIASATPVPKPLVTPASTAVVAPVAAESSASSSSPVAAKVETTTVAPLATGPAALETAMPTKAKVTPGPETKEQLAATASKPAPEKKASRAASKNVPGKKEITAKSPKPEEPARPAEPRVYAVSELPDDIQRDLPKLTISGGTYSANPAQRLLIVNNQVFLENSHPISDVTVVQIRQNAAVLSFRGYRYRVAY